MKNWLLFWRKKSPKMEDLHFSRSEMNSNVIWSKLRAIRRFITKPKSLDLYKRKSIVDSLLEYLHDEDQDIQCECLLLLSAFITCFGKELDLILSNELPRIVVFLGKTDLQLKRASINFFYTYSKQIKNRLKFLEGFIRYGMDNKNQAIQLGSIICVNVFMRLNMEEECLALLLNSLTMMLEDCSWYTSFAIFHSLKTIGRCVDHDKFHGILPPSVQEFYKTFTARPIESPSYPGTCKVFEQLFCDATVNDKTKQSMNLRALHSLFRSANWNILDLLPRLSQFITLMGNFLVNSTVKIQLVCVDLLEVIIEEMKSDVILTLETFVESLLKALACSDRKIRKKGSVLIHRIIYYAHPMVVMDALLQNLHGRNPEVRSEIINIVTSGLFNTSSYSFDLNILCFFIVPFLDDSVLQVHLSALECLITIGHIIFRTQHSLSFLIAFLRTCHVSKRNLNVITASVKKGFLPVYSTEVNTMMDMTSDDSYVTSAPSTAQSMLSTNHRSAFTICSRNNKDRIGLPSAKQGSEFHVPDRQLIDVVQNYEFSKNTSDNAGVKSTNPTIPASGYRNDGIKKHVPDSASTSRSVNRDFGPDYDKSDMGSGITSLSLRDDLTSDDSISENEIEHLTAGEMGRYTSNVRSACSACGTMEERGEEPNTAGPQTHSGSHFSGISYTASADGEEEAISQDTLVSSQQNDCGDALGFPLPAIDDAYAKRQQVLKKQPQNEDKKGHCNVDIKQYDLNPREKNFNILTLDGKYDCRDDIEEVLNISDHSCAGASTTLHSSASGTSTLKSRLLRRKKILSSDPPTECDEISETNPLFLMHKVSHPKMQNVMQQNVHRENNEQKDVQSNAKNIKKHMKSETKDMKKDEMVWKGMDPNCGAKVVHSPKTQSQANFLGHHRQKTYTLIKDPSLYSEDDRSEENPSVKTALNDFESDDISAKESVTSKFSHVESAREDENSKEHCFDDQNSKDKHSDSEKSTNIDDLSDSKSVRVSKVAVKRCRDKSGVVSKEPNANQQNQLQEEIDEKMLSSKHTEQSTSSSTKSKNSLASSKQLKQSVNNARDVRGKTGQQKNRSSSYPKASETKAASERRASDQWSLNIDFPLRALHCSWADSFEKKIKDQRPFDNAEQVEVAMQQNYHHLTEKDLSEKEEYMLSRIRVAKFNPEQFSENLFNKTLHILLHESKNLRLVVAGQSVLTIGYLFMLLKPLESKLRTVIGALLMKSVNHTFAGSYNAVMKSIVYLLKGVPPAKALTVFILEGVQHRNKAVRESAAQFISILTQQMGPQKCLSSNQCKQLLNTGANFLMDCSPLTRHCGKLMFQVFLQHPSFESLKRKYISDKIQFSIGKILKVMEIKGVENETLPIQVIWPQDFGLKD